MMDEGGVFVMGRMRHASRALSVLPDPAAIVYGHSQRPRNDVPSQTS